MAIHDITLTLSESLVVWPGTPPVKLTRLFDLENGDLATLTHAELSAHTGTHVDAPCHFIRGGDGVERLDLDSLIGPALVVDATGAEAISAEVLSRLDIPAGTRRLIVKTDNSQIWTRNQTTFVEEYVAVTADGADWLVSHGVALIGVDYLSVAPFTALVETHEILLSAGIIIVEGLNLNGIAAGTYDFICLPLKIAGSDGAPARAVLID